MGWLVLAAGESKRFGGNKLLAKLHGNNSVLQATIRTLQTTPWPILVVLRSEQWELQALLKGLKCAFTLCDDAQLGMGHSLAWGVQQIASKWSWVGITLADMPSITSATLSSLGQLACEGKIIIPTVPATVTKQADLTEPDLTESTAPDNNLQPPFLPGHPVCFGADFFKPLTQVKGDTGARVVVEQNQNCVTYFQTTDMGIRQDIDTRQDLTDVMATWGGESANVDSD